MDLGGGLVHNSVIKLKKLSDVIFFIRGFHILITADW